MQTARLLMITALLFPIGACSAGTSPPQANKDQSATKFKPTKAKPTAAKAEKPKKNQKSVQAGTKMQSE